MRRECPGIDVQVFSDRDIADKRSEMEVALQGAEVFFGSLLFDYDQVPYASPPYPWPLSVASGAMRSGFVISIPSFLVLGIFAVKVPRRIMARQASYEHRQPQASYKDTWRNAGM